MVSSAGVTRIDHRSVFVLTTVVYANQTYTTHRNLTGLVENLVCCVGLLSVQRPELGSSDVGHELGTWRGGGVGPKQQMRRIRADLVRAHAG